MRKTKAKARRREETRPGKIILYLMNEKNEKFDQLTNFECVGIEGVE